MSALHVLQCGPQTLVQDLGRPGLGGQGITTSGALDRRSLTQGNRLLGNEPGAAGLETLLTGITVTTDAEAVVAVTGAACSVRLDDTPMPFGRPFGVPSGARLRLGRARFGLRSYLTVRGGLRPPGSFAASVSTDTTSGLGAAPVSSGAVLPIGSTVIGDPQFSFSVPAAVATPEITLTLSPGPRAEWVSRLGLRALTSTRWLVTSDTDRVGVRLGGGRIDLLAHSPLPSEAVLTGAVQVPPSGEPIIFLADHPTTGGYPVVAVVDPEDVGMLSQAPPGTAVTLRRRPWPSRARAGEPG